MKLIVTYYIAGLWYNPALLGCRSQINPILGETLQREMATGEKIFCEQISHHPAVTAYSLHGPNGEYTLSGSHKLNAWLNGMNSLGGSKKGKAELVFHDTNTFYSIDNPEMSIENLLGTNKVQVFYKKAHIRDTANNIVAEI